MSIYTTIRVARIKSARSFVKSQALPTPCPNSVRLMTAFPLGHWCFPGAGEHSAVKRLSCLPRAHRDGWDMPSLCHTLHLVTQQTCRETPPHHHVQMLPCCGSNCSKGPPSHYLAWVYLLRKNTAKRFLLSCPNVWLISVSIAIDIKYIRQYFNCITWNFNKIRYTFMGH